MARYNWPFVSLQRCARIFGEMVSVRRMFCADRDFFKMTDFWSQLCDDGGNYSINKYILAEDQEYKLRAGVVAFGDRVTLTLSDRLWDRADMGFRQENFVLAHEVSHVALDHHSKGAVTKNFQLFAGSRGMSNMPPTPEELEANYGAVFLQCGIALRDAKWDTIELAKRAHTDFEYVRKVKALVRLEGFEKELRRPRPLPPRVIL